MEEQLFKMHHINTLSVIGAGATAMSYATYTQTLSIVALIITILTGLVTMAYTIFKWIKDEKDR